MKNILSSSFPLIYLLFFCLYFFSCSDRSVSPTAEEEKPTNNGFDLEVVTDIDGNVYPTKRIGGQLWMDRHFRQYP